MSKPSSQLSSHMKRSSIEDNSGLIKNEDHERFGIEVCKHHYTLLLMSSDLAYLSGHPYGESIMRRLDFHNESQLIAAQFIESTVFLEDHFHRICGNERYERLRSAYWWYLRKDFNPNDLQQFLRISQAEDFPRSLPEVKSSALMLSPKQADIALQIVDRTFEILEDVEKLLKRNCPTFGQTQKNKSLQFLRITRSSLEKFVFKVRKQTLHDGRTP